MSGQVFHPGHEELHGVTVVVETTGPLTYLGRYDREDELGVHVLDVGIHDPSKDQISKDDFIGKSIKFGIRSEQKHIIIPPTEIARIRRLSES